MGRPSCAVIALVVVMLLTLSRGLVSDLSAIPPDYGVHCPRSESLVFEETSSDNLAAPPPAVDQQSAGGDAKVQVSEASIIPFAGQPYSLLDWQEISPRLGIGLNGTRHAETWSRRLGFSWYVDWRTQRRYPTQFPEHWQMIRLQRGCFYPSEDAIHWLATHYPGNVWIMGNEPDNIWQDNIFPEEYAQVYHHLYYLIKKIDPTALIAVSGVTQATPLRLAYLDRVLTAYKAIYHEPMPVDWWTVHGFVLREERGNWGADIPAGFPGTKQGKLYEIDDMGDVLLFKEHVLAFRTWMAENGYRDTPLAMTEFGISFFSEYGYTPDVVAQYLWDTFTWLAEARDEHTGYPGDDNRLVQRWAWYSLYSEYYSASNLTNLESNGLTQIGISFREFSAQSQK